MTHQPAQRLAYYWLGGRRRYVPGLPARCWGMAELHDLAAEQGLTVPELCARADASAEYVRVARAPLPPLAPPADALVPAAEAPRRRRG